LFNSCFLCSCSLCFFSLFLLSHIFTLFPYTTLFRSHRRVPRGRGPSLSNRLLLDRLHGELQHDATARGTRRPPRSRDELLRAGLDRKSTRLNSSHEWISYAVFCLKKKK